MRTLAIILGMLPAACGFAQDKAPWRGPQPPEGRRWPTDGHFFLRHWFQMGDEFANPSVNGRFRVNDPYAATHPDFHSRPEPKGNGLMLIPMNESLREIEAARLSLELWGGHPGTTNRRVTVNGRTTYPILVPSEDQCTHAYPEIPLKITDLVQGYNALQFAVDGDKTFWGHFIVDEAAIDVLLPAGSSRLTSLRSLLEKPPQVQVYPEGPESWSASVPIGHELIPLIAAVHFYGRYDCFDENGDGRTDDWHGLTKRKTPLGHLGTVTAAPYRILWDTTMLPAQGNVTVRAVIEFRPDAAEARREAELQEKTRFWKARSLYYQTASSEPFTIAHPAGLEVTRVPASHMSIPFWSRANRPRTCEFDVTIDPELIERATLSIAVWDGGAGDVQEPFLLNGHSLPIAAGGKHDVLLTTHDVPAAWLTRGVNRAVLRSDTEHHGIEVLFPGPVLTIRSRRAAGR